jgi:hypothetical protein
VERGQSGFAVQRREEWRQSIGDRLIEIMKLDIDRLLEKKA